MKACIVIFDMFKDLVITVLAYVKETVKYSKYEFFNVSFFICRNNSINMTVCLFVFLCVPGLLRPGWCQVVVQWSTNSFSCLHLNKYVAFIVCYNIRSGLFPDT